MNREGILIPPRPLPGLEALPSSRSVPSFGLIVTLLLGIIGAAFWFRARRKNAATAAPSRTALVVPPTYSPEENVVRLREALVARFGPSWLTRTTEEIAASPDLISVLGEESARSLNDWLAEVDRLRFAPGNEGVDGSISPPGPWLTTVLDQLRPQTPRG